MYGNGKNIDESRLLMSFVSLSLPHSLYTLQCKHTKQSTLLDMYMNNGQVTTKYLPDTYSILHDTYPAVLQTKCFNAENLPFYQEVIDTEIGHLFEHILLQYMCDIKGKHTCCTATHSGVTSWDWKKEKRGIFHISIDVPYSDKKLFALALHQTVKLVDQILMSAIPTQSNLTHVIRDPVTMITQVVE